MQKHQLIAFRRVAAKLYKKNLKWRKAVNMATADGLFTDAMETAAQSASRELVKELLQFFVDEAQDQHSFAACLFTCQGLVGFHTALELAWLNQEALPGILTLCMPFFVACIREYTGKARPPASLAHSDAACCSGSGRAVQRHLGLCACAAALRIAHVRHRLLACPGLCSSAVVCVLLSCSV